MSTTETPFTEQFMVDVPEGKSGEWAIQKFIIEDDIRLLRIQMKEPSRVPKVGETYTQLMQDKAYDPMMSDTPAEIRDLIEPWLKFKEPWVDRVLINGLGLGIVLKMALAQPHIQHIDVVEIEPDVIKLVAPSYDDPRVQIHAGNAYTIKWPKGQEWSVVWHDIWPNICTDNLEGMGTLHRRYGRRVVWQGSWQREYLQYQRRREQSCGW